MLQLTPLMRAFLQIAIRIFMVGTALRLLNVHPFFRHFAIEPPKAVTRYIRRKTKNSNDNWLAPTFLGALTVLIPCGITQAMMALAIASGQPGVRGADNVRLHARDDAGVLHSGLSCHQARHQVAGPFLEVCRGSGADIGPAGN